MIPQRLQDPTTMVKGHNFWTHLPCILLRILIGLGIIDDYFSVNQLIILSVFVVVFFGYKFFKLPNVWKVYARTVIVYGLMLGLILLNKYKKYKDVMGVLVIVDALMGLQSRHIFTQLSNN